jgi:hypothetical protein
MSSSNSTFYNFSSNSNKFSEITVRDFMESNTLIAKVAFLLLVVFIFIILLRLGISLLSWLMSPKESPHLLDGMVDAKQMLVFTQDPSSSTSATIYRSVNATDGLEFTWSVWIYIDDLQYLQGQFKHVFSKGNSDIQTNGLVYPNNAPGLYIAPNKNDLIVMMNTYNVINHEIVIPDIPLNKWVNVIIRCQNTTLDVYINGTITRSMQLPGIPKQNYGDVYVALNGGFSGNISNLWYYNYALGTADINAIAQKGPNVKFTGSGAADGMKSKDYLSLRWYFYGAKDSFNPGPIN